MATLVRPGSPELILHIKPKRGEVFSRPELFSLIGIDYVPIELRSGDFLLVSKDFENKLLKKNELGSTLTKKSIYGPAIICESQEID